MNGLIKRGFRYAVKAAYLSDMHTYRVGAALMNKNRVISIGWNSTKTHPKCPTKYSRHAEFNVFVGVSPLDVSGCTLFVARITKTNRASMAMPCKDCQMFLRALNLRRIFFTNRIGEMEIL